MAGPPAPVEDLAPPHYVKGSLAKTIRFLFSSPGQLGPSAPLD
jgi:hypothetical protein